MATLLATFAATVLATTATVEAAVVIVVTTHLIAARMPSATKADRYHDGLL